MVASAGLCPVGSRAFLVVVYYQAMLADVSYVRCGFRCPHEVWITGPRETHELAAVLRVTRGAIAGSVSTLEKRGLVRRIHSTIDRRLVTVGLTDSGRDLVVQAQKDWHSLEMHVTAGLTVNEQRTLAILLRKMDANARALRSKHKARSSR